MRNQPMRGHVLSVCGVLIAGLCSVLSSLALAHTTSIHHELDIVLRPEQRALAATDVLTIQDGPDPLCLGLAGNASVSEVTANGRPVDFSFRNGRLCLLHPLTAPDGEKNQTVRVSYTAVFDDPVPRNPIHTEDPSYGVVGTVTPEGTLLLGGARWYPQISPETGTFQLRVRAPAGYEAATAGRCTVRNTEDGVSTSLWEISIPTRGLALSAGPYVITKRHVGKIPLYTYFWKEDQSLSSAYLEAAARYVQLYDDLIGPYPFEKFAVVANFFPTGYGFPSYTLLGRRVIRLPFILETSLGHEIAHSWWGNCVHVDYERGNWSEGLTTYVADHLYKERASLEEGRAYRLKILRDYAVLVPPEKDFALREFISRVSPATRVIGYGKAAMVFHMARRALGDEDFWGGLSAVFGEKAFKKASWNDFAVILGRVGDKDLHPFFTQWVDRVGAPRLTLDHVSAKRKGDTWTVRGDIVQQSPVFALAVPVRLETKAHRTDQMIVSSTEQTPFVFRSAHRPIALRVDPEIDVFRRLWPEEVPATVNSLKASEKLAVLLAANISPELREAGRILLKGLGLDGVSIFQEETVRMDRFKDHDLLVIGMPKKSAWVPTFPEGVSFFAESFQVKDQVYERETDSAFITFFDPHRGDRIVAVFVAPSIPEASVVARKIPHYGKYSYLVFQGEENQAKEIWPITASPLVHRFPE